MTENPCTEDRCEEYHKGDCPGGLWLCLIYRKYRKEKEMPTVEELAEDVEQIKERMKGIENMPIIEEE